MNPKNELTVPKWPFFVANGLFVVAAAMIRWSAAEPLGAGAILGIILLFAIGACLSLVPYLLEVYWNWQFAKSEYDEKLEEQQRAMARTIEQMDKAARRCEAIDSPSAPAPNLAVFEQQLEQLGRTLEQCQKRFDHQAEAVAKQLGSWREEDEESGTREREQSAKILAVLEEVRRQLSKTGELRDEEVRPPPPAEEPPVSIPEPEEEYSPPEELEEEPELAAVSVDVNEVEEGESDDGEDVPEPPPAAPRRTKKAKKPQVREADANSLFSTTTVVATSFIGASNKLYLRGDGPGLSWDEGVPMRFVEIGKWSWTTTEATGPIQLQIFKNDEEEDKAGVLTVEPGQRLDLRPDFDA